MTSPFLRLPPTDGKRPAFVRTGEVTAIHPHGTNPAWSIVRTEDGMIYFAAVPSDELHATWLELSEKLRDEFREDVASINSDGPTGYGDGFSDLN